MASESSITAQTVLRYIVGLAIAASIVFLLWYFRDIVIYILVSAVLAIVGRFLVDYLAKIHIGERYMPRGLASAVTLVVMWCVFGLLFALFVPLVFGKINELSTLDMPSVMASVEQPLNRLQHYISVLFSVPAADISMSDLLRETLKNIIDYRTVNNAFSSVISWGVSGFIAFFSISFITFFFMKEEGLFSRMVLGLFPDKYQTNAENALHKVTWLLSRYFTGILAESGIIMIIISSVLWLFGMRVQDACFIGLVMGVMNVIPYAGPTMGGILSVVMGVISPVEGWSIASTVMLITGTLVSVKVIDDFIIQPTLYSSRVKAHPLEIFIVILIAGYVGGVVGMLLAIPSYTVLRVFAKEFFSEFSLVRKLTEQI